MVIVHFRIRKGPLKLHKKIVRSIDVYSTLNRTINRLQAHRGEQSMPKHSDARVHFERRRTALLKFIKNRQMQYEKLYNDPYKRIILRLPPPKTLHDEA